jgi:hypothetical protein
MCGQCQVLYILMFHETHWLIGWLVSWLIDWPTEWLTDWLIDLFIDWLIDWLIKWLEQLIALVIWDCQDIQQMKPKHENLS